MATLSVIKSAHTGAALATVPAAAGGDVFPNSGNEIVYIRNSSGSSVTVTFAAPGKPRGATVAAESATVGAGQHRIVGPFPPGIFNSTAGEVAITYSATTSVVVAVFSK